jgi:hypothetical protein
MKTIRLVLSLVAAAALAAAAPAFIVTLDTSSLVGTGTYYVDFQLNDGNGVGDANNTATIKNINLGGGSIVGPATTWGGAAGDLGGTVTLIDTDAFNEFYQAFLPGSFLSFDLYLPNHFNGAIPDIFGFAILDENLWNLPTYAPGSDQFVTMELNGGPITAETYGSLSGIAAPTVTVPDLGSTALLLLAGICGLLAVRPFGRGTLSA